MEYKFSKSYPTYFQEVLISNGAFEIIIKRKHKKVMQACQVVFPLIAHFGR